MSNESKKISITDLPESAATDVASDDVQPLADNDVKGGGRFGTRVGVRYATGDVRKISGIRVRTGKRAIIGTEGANTWIK